MCRAGSKSFIPVLPGMTETCPSLESQDRAWGFGSRHQQKHMPTSQGPPQDDQENILLLEKGDNTTMLKTSKNRQAGRQAGSTKHRTGSAYNDPKEVSTGSLYFVFCFFATSLNLQNPTYSTRDRTCIPCIGSIES